MKQQKTFWKTNQTELSSVKKSEGYIILMMIPVFLTILAFATSVAGCISCSIKAMAHWNEMMQAYSLLENDEAVWQKEALSAKWKNVYETDYEKIMSTQKVGPYILLVKEMRNKMTGKVLVNRLEFIPIVITDDLSS